jgi:hypothetical protein
MIQDAQTPYSVAKVIGFLLIPFYNLYWFFIVVTEWPKQMRNYTIRHGLSLKRPKPELYLQCAVASLGAMAFNFIFSWLFAPLGLLIGLLGTAIMLFLAYTLCGDINQLAAAKR